MKKVHNGWKLGPIQFYWNSGIPWLEGLRYYGIAIGGFAIGYWSERFEDFEKLVQE